MMMICREAIFIVAQSEAGEQGAEGRLRGANETAEGSFHASINRMTQKLRGKRGDGKERTVVLPTGMIENGLFHPT